MKKGLIFILAILLSTSAFSQYKLRVGDIQVNAGVAANFFGGGAIYVGADYGVHRIFSVGAEGSYHSYTDKYKDIVNTVGILANVNAHFSGLFGMPDEWDIYMGLSPGMFFRNTPSTNTKSNDFGIGGQVGVRYYFTDQLAANVEIGGGTVFQNGKIGISYIF